MASDTRKVGCGDDWINSYAGKRQIIDVSGSCKSLLPLQSRQTEDTQMFLCSCPLFRTPCHSPKNDYKTSPSNPTYVNLFINAVYFTRILYCYNSVFPFKLPLFHAKTNLQSLICTTDTRICTNLLCDWHHISKNFSPYRFLPFFFILFCRPRGGTNLSTF